MVVTSLKGQLKRPLRPRDRTGHGKQRCLDSRTGFSASRSVLECWQFEGIEEGVHVGQKGFTFTSREHFRGPFAHYLPQTVGGRQGQCLNGDTTEPLRARRDHFDLPVTAVRREEKAENGLEKIAFRDAMRRA